MKNVLPTFFRSFKGRIIVPTMLILLALAIFISFYLSAIFSAYSEHLILEKVSVNANTLDRYLDEARLNTITAAVSLTNDPKVIQAIAKRDRKEILRLLETAPELYRVNYFSITDAVGTIIARTNEPNTFGDSVADLETISGAMAGQVVSAFEDGKTVRVSIRTAVPAKDSNGKLVGIISAGVRFDDDKEVETLKELMNSEVTVFLGNKRVATTITRFGGRVVGTLLDPKVARIVLEEKSEYDGNIHILGENYKTHYKPLINNAGEAFAAIVLASPLSGLKAASNKLVRRGLAICVIGLAVASTVLSYFLTIVSRPITILSNDTKHIASGHLGLDVQFQKDDEIGQLGKSLQNVVIIIRKLIEGINTMIYEHEHGNTEYCIDTEPFQGDYKVLAVNILDLAVLGIRDQLTGLANRRSFDNRLEIAWLHGIREKTPTSLLIIDIDNFRNYNDTYGHHQGDMALKTTANSICNCIKRDIDFVARWGSDKFIVLMPNTDTRGALSVAERVRTEISTATIPVIESIQSHKRKPKNIKALHEESLTACIGVSSQIPMKNTSVDDLLAGADEALMRAKESGNKNKIALKNDKTVAIF
ncbi:MAG: diguanylate cyclase [Holophagaceae bacterium]|nr:diguanylate cyclase [Holophagaceae bacterium]